MASAEKNVRYVKGNSADSDSSRFVRSIKFDAARNDENDGYAESDKPDDGIPEMESVTLASKMESGNKISGSDRKSSVSPEISNVDPRNYKNSQRQEADKSYAERKLMEIETKQIETANNKIKLQNKAEAASKWVLNSLLNSEKSPNRKDFKAADNYETDDDNEVESDDSDRNSNIDTDPIDNIVLGSSNKSKNLLYDEAQVRKLSSSSSAPSAGDIKSTAATEESRYTDIMTEERKNSPITTNAISTRLNENTEIIATLDIQDNKPKINEVKKEKIPTRVDPIEVKRTVIKSSITNIDNGALTQTLTAVINEKSSNSYFVKPNLNVILKKSLKDSLYPINPDGTYTTKETVRPIKETSLINDFVRNSIIISEKVEMERRLSRMEETVEIGTESDELKGSSMTEVTNDDDEADALQQKVEGRNSDIVGNEDVLRQEIDDNYDVDVDVHKGESKATVNNTKGITLKEDEKEDENEQENIESKKSIELANGKIILDDDFSTRDQNEKDENIDDSDKENLSIISDKEKYSLPPIGSITKPNMVSSNSAVTTFASAGSVSSSSTTLSPPLVTLSASAISDVPPASIPIVTPTLQSLNSSLEKDNKDEIKGEVEVEVEAEIESQSRVSASTSTYLSTSLPVSADIRTQLISTAAEELGITGGDISIESDEEINMNEVRDEYTLEANDVERIEDEDEAGTDSAKPAAEYNSFPYYTPPPPPYTNAPRCLLGSWELSETRYIDEARCVHTLRVSWTKFYPYSHAILSSQGWRPYSTLQLIS